MSKYLTIRLSQSESDALTRVRASWESVTGDRITIKQILRALIIAAHTRHKSETLGLPLSRSIPALAEIDVVERISYLKTETEDRALAEISATPAGPVKYGHASVIRELIQLADTRAAKKAAKNAKRKPR